MVKIFIGNLNPNSKSSDLRKRFELYGKVTECDIVNNYAFVHMENESDAEAAIAKLHNSDFDGVKINVEMSHGKRSGPGGPIRRRFNDRGYPPRDFRDDQFRGPPRPYMRGPDGPRGPGGVNTFGPMRESRFVAPSWEDRRVGPYPPQRDFPRDNPRGYDYQINGGNNRFQEREPERPRGVIRDQPFNSAYRGGNSETFQPNRDFQRRGSSPPPLRGRYENDDSFGDYERFREPVPPTYRAPPRSSDFNDSYGSYSGGGGYENPNREFRDADRGRSFNYEYGSYDRQPNRSPAPRTAVGFNNYGRP